MSAMLCSFASIDRWLDVLQHFGLDIYGATLGYSSSSAIEAAKFMIYVSMTLIGDGFMVRIVARS